jgi:hypothetical protein
MKKGNGWGCKLLEIKQNHEYNAGVLVGQKKFYLENRKCHFYICNSSLKFHLSRKAEGNGPMKP